MDRGANKITFAFTDGTVRVQEAIVPLRSAPLLQRSSSRVSPSPLAPSADETLSSASSSCGRDLVAAEDLEKERTLERKPSCRRPPEVGRPPPRPSADSLQSYLWS